jgi:type II secretory pathway component PulJ
MNARFGKRGFALIVVLGTLSLIALLFATAQIRLLARVADSSTEALIAERALAQRSLLRLAADLYGAGDVPPEQVLTVPYLGGEAQVRLRDVAGLVDLNTGNPEMLDRLAEALGVTAGQMAAYRDWRRAPHRLHSVRDFGRVAGTSRDAVAGLEQIATVFSGRFGIAPDHAPPRLLGLLPAALPEGWVDAPTGRVFNVVLQGDTGRDVLLGTIRLSDGPGEVIDLY